MKIGQGESDASTNPGGQGLITATRSPEKGLEEISAQELPGATMGHLTPEVRLLHCESIYYRLNHPGVVLCPTLQETKTKAYRAPLPHLFWVTMELGSTWKCSISYTGGETYSYLCDSLNMLSQGRQVKPTGAMREEKQSGSCKARQCR